MVPIKAHETSYGVRRRRVRAQEASEGGETQYRDLLTHFLDLSASKKGSYDLKAKEAKRVYAVLAAADCSPRRLANYPACVAFAKCLEDFLVELKRIHVCVSCRLSRDKRGSDDLKGVRKVLSGIITAVRKRIAALRKKFETLSSKPTDVEEKKKKEKIAAAKRLFEVNFQCCPEHPHLCVHRCFYRDHEAARKWKELKDYCEWHCLKARRGKGNDDEDCCDSIQLLSGWSTKLVACPKSELKFKAVYVSPEGINFSHIRQALKHLGIGMDPQYTISSLYALKNERGGGDGGGGQTIRLTGKEVASPYGLIEELFCDDVWKLLVCCLLLVQTTRKQLDPVLARFFCKFPGPRELLKARCGDIESLILPLGLQKKRSKTLLQFSKEFVEKEWISPRELHGIGDYGEAAYDIFYRGKVALPVQDHALNWYVEWKLLNKS